MEPKTFLGQFEVDISETPFAKYSPTDWALKWLFEYAQIDGSHRKQWCLDQVTRILIGTKVIVQLAKWSDGTQEYRYWLESEPSDGYQKFIEEHRGEYNEHYDEYEYTWDTGIAP